MEGTIPSNVYYTSVFCSRFGDPLPRGAFTKSLFDDIRVELISLPAGYVPPET
jgi:hypothetical protein